MTTLHIFRSNTFINPPDENILMASACVYYNWWMIGYRVPDAYPFLRPGYALVELSSKKTTKELATIFKSVDIEVITPSHDNLIKVIQWFNSNKTTLYMNDTMVPMVIRNLYDVLVKQANQLIQLPKVIDMEIKDQHSLLAQCISRTSIRVLVPMTQGIINDTVYTPHQIRDSKYEFDVQD